MFLLLTVRARPLQKGNKKKKKSQLQEEMCESVTICGMDALELNVPAAPLPTNYADTQCSHRSGPSHEQTLAFFFFN